MQYATRVVDIILERNAAYTQTALRNRIVFIAFNLDELSALIGVKLQRTAYRMAARGGTTGLYA